MDYNRYTIDLINASFAHYVATGKKDDQALSAGITELSKAIDRAYIEGEDTNALNKLKKDLETTLYII